jgi:hypothetical protein
MRVRAVAPAMTRCCDRVLYLVVSLCEDYVNFCVKNMYCCVKAMDFR